MPGQVGDTQPVNEPVVDPELERETAGQSVQPVLRRSARTRREPDRLNLYLDAKDNLPETFV